MQVRILSRVPEISDFGVVGYRVSLKRKRLLFDSGKSDQPIQNHVKGNIMLQKIAEIFEMFAHKTFNDENSPIEPREQLNLLWMFITFQVLADITIFFGIPVLNTVFLTISVIYMILILHPLIKFRFFS